MSPYTRLRQLAHGALLSRLMRFYKPKDIGEPSVLNRAGGAPHVSGGYCYGVP